MLALDPLLLYEIVVLGVMPGNGSRPVVENDRPQVVGQEEQLRAQLPPLRR